MRSWHLHARPYLQNSLIPPGNWWSVRLKSAPIRIQQFYRSLNRNGYNMGLLSVETPSSRLELRLVITVRSNYAPWVRSDHTGFEVMLGDMTTFVAPEQTAEWARPFFVD
jgi:UDPglucose--hexose-1-phosphate uridylyltransferase